MLQFHDFAQNRVLRLSKIIYFLKCIGFGWKSVWMSRAWLPCRSNLQNADSLRSCRVTLSGSSENTFHGYSRNVYSRQDSQQTATSEHHHCWFLMSCSQMTEINVLFTAPSHFSILYLPKCVWARTRHGHTIYDLWWTHLSHTRPNDIQISQASRLRPAVRVQRQHRANFAANCQKKIKKCLNFINFRLRKPNLQLKWYNFPVLFIRLGRKFACVMRIGSQF